MKPVLFGLAALGTTFLAGCADHVYVDQPAPAPVAQVTYVPQPPPPVIVERVTPPRPGPRYVWVRGNYVWNGYRYVWRPGYWVRAPRPHAHYYPAYWRHDSGGYVFVEGHF